MFELKQMNCTNTFQKEINLNVEHTHTRTDEHALRNFTHLVYGVNVTVNHDLINKWYKTHEVESVGWENTITSSSTHTIPNLLAKDKKRATTNLINFITKIFGPKTREWEIENDEKNQQKQWAPSRENSHSTYICIFNAKKTHAFKS